jgi:hypothetical protein
MNHGHAITSGGTRLECLTGSVKGVKDRSRRPSAVKEPWPEPAGDPGAGAADLAADVLGRYQSIYRAALNAWCRSRRAKPEPPAAERGDKGPSKKKQSAGSEGPPGNPVFLAKAMEALKAIRALKGLDAPRRNETAGPDGGPVPPVDDLKGMTYEQLCVLEAQLLAEIEPAGDAAPPPQTTLKATP